MIKVKLLREEITKNRHTLYLDFYPAIPNPKTGKPTRREFLKLYLYDKPRTPFDREHNVETLKMAEMKRLQRYNDLNKPEIYTDFERDQLKLKEFSESSFTDYFKKLSNKKHKSWIHTSMHIQNFAGHNLNFSDITFIFCNSFREYLLTANYLQTKIPVSQNTAALYYNIFKSSLKRAYNDGYLPVFLNFKLKPIALTETRRNYLTMDELNNLIKTPCKYPDLKRAALFSALTGLRFSDISKLTWQEVDCPGGTYSLNFTQQKTGGVESLPVSNQAASLLGERAEPLSKPFPKLKYDTTMQINLNKWVAKAGITKKITFHCFRHTFATLQLTGGTDIYTVSKLLGHRDLKTTQIYAKVIDKSKRDAVNRITLNF